MIGWLVDERGIEPHVKLMDKAELNWTPFVGPRVVEFKV
jgi:hypothetical protein